MTAAARPTRTVAIDCFADSIRRYREFTIVAVDIIRATTTAITGVSGGRRCIPVRSIEEALPVAAALDRPLLVGELGGNVPYGFDLGNSPLEVAERPDMWRPMILLTTSGTGLMCDSEQGDGAYVACLRNWSATVSHLAANDPHVALIGAGSRGEFREEDQLGCAWIAAGLVRAGYEPWNTATVEIIERWGDAPAESAMEGKSAAYLSDTGQEKDLGFILDHLDDLGQVFTMAHGEVVESRA